MDIKAITNATKIFNIMNPQTNLSNTVILAENLGKTVTTSEGTLQILSAINLTI